MYDPTSYLASKILNAFWDMVTSNDEEKSALETALHNTIKLFESENLEFYEYLVLKVRIRTRLITDSHLS